MRLEMTLSLKNYTARHRDDNKEKTSNRGCDLDVLPNSLH